MPLVSPGVSVTVEDDSFYILCGQYLESIDYYKDYPEEKPEELSVPEKAPVNVSVQEPVINFNINNISFVKMCHYNIIIH